jgi:hypothetical protein
MLELRITWYTRQGFAARGLDFGEFRFAQHVESVRKRIAPR